MLRKTCDEADQTHKQYRAQDYHARCGDCACHIGQRHIRRRYRVECKEKVQRQIEEGVGCRECIWSQQLWKKIGLEEKTFRLFLKTRAWPNGKIVDDKNIQKARNARTGCKQNCCYRQAKCRTSSCNLKCLQGKKQRTCSKIKDKTDSDCSVGILRNLRNIKNSGRYSKQISHRNIQVFKRREKLFIVI